MKLLVFLLLAILAVKISAEPASSPAQAFRYQFPDESMKSSNTNYNMLNGKSEPFSGRLFFRKFLFNKLFGQKPSPPVIPIIITRPNTDYTTDIDTPTSTAVNTPTATTTISDPAPITNTLDTETPITTNTPADPAQPVNPAEPANPTVPIDPIAPPTDPTVPTRRFQLFDPNEDDNDAVAVAPERINFRLRGDKYRRIFAISSPTKYRDPFQNGQLVVLQGNKGSHSGKRRIVRRRKNRRRNNKSKKNKRRRVIAI